MADRSISLAFGSLIRKRRKANGLSQEALAERADIHHTHVGLIERGQRNASLDVADRVARALGLPLSALIAEAEKHRGGPSASSVPPSTPRTWSPGHKGTGHRRRKPLPRADL